MRFFHVTIHAQPSQAASWEQIFVESCSVPVLRLAADELSAAFAVTFDDVAKRLTELDRLFFEPDGSFVWVSNNGPTEWQLDGLLNDLFIIWIFS